MIYWQCAHEPSPRLSDRGEAPRFQKRSICHPTLEVVIWRSRLVFCTHSLTLLKSQW